MQKLLLISNFTIKQGIIHFKFQAQSDYISKSNDLLDLILIKPLKKED